MSYRISDNLMAAIDCAGSWQLHKIAPSTYCGDLSDTRTDPDISARLSTLIRCGKAYRFKIGKSHWYFGETAEKAAAAAFKGYQATIAAVPTIKSK